MWLKVLQHKTSWKCNSFINIQGLSCMFYKSCMGSYLAFNTFVFLVISVVPEFFVLEGISDHILGSINQKLSVPCFKFLILHFMVFQFLWTIHTLTHFFPNATFLYHLKTSENVKVFWCFQGVEKGCNGNEWIDFGSILLYHIQVINTNYLTNKPIACQRTFLAPCHHQHRCQDRISLE